MTQSHLTRVAVCIDRSGSMGSIHTAMISGYNEFLNTLKSNPGECSIKVTQFDTEYEHVYDAPLFRARALTANDCLPRGGTALNDAFGRTIDELGSELDKLPEAERPSKVICLIISDGLENSSKRYTKSQVANMVRHQAQKYGWEFLYLGANQDAILTGKEYNIPQGQSLTYAANTYGVANSMNYAGLAVNAMRSGVSYEFTPEQRRDGLVDVDHPQNQSQRPGPVPVPEPTTATASRA